MKFICTETNQPRTLSYKYKIAVKEVEKQSTGRKILNLKLYEILSHIEPIG